jgi:hypothetical protein
MSGWCELRAALDAVAERGEAIRLWWRDDDAGRDHRTLIRLLDLAEARAVPLALAVVPAWLEARAQAGIAASGQASVLQHGYAHANHAPPGSKSIELGGRDPAVVRGELERGRDVLLDAFGAIFLAVLVPPWNRIDPAVVTRLKEWGFVGLSTFGPRPATEDACGLMRANARLDPVDWRGTRLFVGEVQALGQLVGMLDLDEPIGILTHHLVMDEGGWDFLERLLAITGKHPGVRWCTAGEIFETAA